MEHIELIHPSLIADLPERTAQALDWLSRVSAPPEDVVGSSKDAMGPVGGGLIRHRFFKDDEAPLDFSSIDALGRHMNESDMHVSNFGVDQSDNTVLLDFGQIGRLPLSFAKYSMNISSDDIFTPISCANPTLDLDKDDRKVTHEH
ncbi:hypothetical protein C8J57DRAFT_1607772 [Mycena rebaudengoi]|nr:hypothetical protein C8J57DRAFT_1607772 [Mycena rebaudengoi]